MSATTQGNRWLARDWTELFAELQGDTEPRGLSGFNFDVLILGSGYGGAMAAAELAGACNAQGQHPRIGVIERGREYLPGAFPARMADLPTQLRGSAAGQVRGGEGLFDLRLGGDMGVILANGLGGGSLINAGVMETPREAVFNARWPEAWRHTAHREPLYAAALSLLGAVDAKGANTINRAGALPAKTSVLKKMGGSAYNPAAITVALEAKTTIGGVALSPCKQCGDCATGCNYSAKESLDTNLLALAHARGAQIYCGATALQLRRIGGAGWRVQLTPTDEKLRAREGAPRWVTAERVIVAAGTLGSAELLLRSSRPTRDEPDALRFSERLGQGFSGNGDMIAFVYNQPAKVNAIADEDTPPGKRQVGPTITGVVDAVVAPEAGCHEHIVVEDLAVPGALKRFTEELVTTGDTLHSLGEFDCSCHDQGHPAYDPIAVQPAKMRRTSVLAAMGDDGANGWLELTDSEPKHDTLAADGRLRVRWPEASKLKLFERQCEVMGKAAEALGKKPGRLLPNPLWRPLPEAMEELIGGARGPLLSVHPLGGCRMADRPADGVVDARGRVFTGEASGAVHDGLFVLDGSIIPTALATNPALTIAAVALGAVRQLRDDWGWLKAEDKPIPSSPRPVIADIEADIAARQKAGPKPTQAQFSERLTGPVQLINDQGQPEHCVAELTLTYRPLALRNLFAPSARGKLSNARLVVGPASAHEPSEGALCIYRAADWQKVQDLWPGHPLREQESPPVLTYPVQGTLTLLRREARGPVRRTWQGLKAWVPNRGVRDSAQALSAWWVRKRGGTASTGGGSGVNAAKRALDALKLANYAGELRLFEYDLQVGTPLAPPAAGAFLPRQPLDGAVLRGKKRITYARPSNPWRQLMELPIEGLPGLANPKAPPVLVLDPVYLATRGAPLFQITEQRDHLEALADAGSLMANFARLLLRIHLWNARKPEPPPARAPQRLPGALPGLPEPTIHTLEVDQLRGEPVSIRLTHYRRKEGLAQATPVVLIHGYSASGTTFAHASLKPGLADTLAKAGRDVWVLDLRTSCGLATAQHAWSFERVALADIPAAIAYVTAKTGQAQVDVVAHCMGAAMFGMAVLSAGQEIDAVLSGREIGKVHDRYRSERQQLPKRVRRAVFSQVGPVMVLSPENIFRAYALAFVEQVLGGINYQFRAASEPQLGDELLDRLLSSLPYPDDELRLENNWKFWRSQSHLGTRHRMDALYGRTFKLDNLRPETLKHIDDFFGPLNLDTVSQVMHFAALRTITNRAGRNRFVSQQQLTEHWPFATLSLHGSDNGLSDPATLRRMERTWRNAGRSIALAPLANRGHQDTLIGRHVADTFERISQFLAAPEATPEATPAAGSTAQRVPPPPLSYLARPPALGPLLLPQPDTTGRCRWHLSLGAALELGTPEAVCLWPLTEHEPGKPPQRDSQRLHVEMLNDESEGDWLSLELPAWAQDGAVTRMLVLLLYRQPGSMGLPNAEQSKAAPPGPGGWSNKEWSGTALIQRDPRKRLELHRAITQALTVPKLVLQHGAKGEAGADHAVIRKAVEDAVQQLGDAGQLAEGIVLLPGPERQPQALSAEQPLRLALGSCQYAPGILDTPPAYAGWRQLSRDMDAGLPAPDWIVLTGDQVYTDATAGLFDPSQMADRYRKPYEKWLADVDVRDLLRRAPLLTAIDDHEIDDNWEPLSGEAPAGYRARHDQRGEVGLTAFKTYQRPWRAGTEASEASAPPASTWFHCQRHGVPAFVLDTRTARAHRDSREPGRLMDAAQAEALTQWLGACCQRDPTGPKLIIGPGLLLPRHRRAVPAKLAHGVTDAGDGARLYSDSWDGYPQELYSLLNRIAAERWQGLVFLSGDEHLGLASRIRLQAKEADPVQVFSLHAPGLYTPYHFANARPADLLLNETFEVPHTAVPGCTVTVSTQCFEAPGFLRVSLWRTAEGWRLRYRASTGDLVNEWALT